ncbi:MEMO1 family [Lactifluus volemus]|nr:MEMO1 family [Lactifluus volemus]
MSIRRPTHADSWYTANSKELDRELSNWLEAVVPSSSYTPPIVNCKAIIAPHAGYSYSGPAAAWAYKSINTTGIKRVFILGPSHHAYLDGCALSKCTEYATPIGALPLDRSTIDQLDKTGQFSQMQLSTDEDEHSIEMHLPYVRKIFEGQEISVVPILVGAIDEKKEEAFGRILAPYLASTDTFFVISSDFCHWGTRFSYTLYFPQYPPGSTPPIKLSRSTTSPRELSTFPIHESISALDHEAMELITLPSSSARQAHASLPKEHAKLPHLQWVRYEQSSQCFTIKDSSVSYASAYIAF